MSSLDHMTSVVASRPSHFPRREDAVQWSLVSGAMRNPESARVSVPDQLVRCTPSDSHSHAQGNINADGHASEDVSASTPAAPPSGSYRWRTDLLSSQPYWSGWFAGLSALFLSCTMPKMLLLAGSDRLDTPMMIAHMQGKLQLEVLADAGHSVQEDQPRDTARKLAEFVLRHRLSTTGAAWAAQSQVAATHAPATATPASKPPVPLFCE